MKFSRVSQVSELTGLYPVVSGECWWNTLRFRRTNLSLKELHSDDIGEESQTDSNA